MFCFASPYVLFREFVCFFRQVHVCVVCVVFGESVCFDRRVRMFCSASPYALLGSSYTDTMLSSYVRTFRSVRHTER